MINEFIAARTTSARMNGAGRTRTARFAIEIVRRVRERVGDDFIIIIYRLSMLDLVEEGSTPEEVIALAQAIELLVPRSSTLGSAGMRHEFRPLPPAFRALPFLG